MKVFFAITLTLEHFLSKYYTVKKISAVFCVSILPSKKKTQSTPLSPQNKKNLWTLLHRPNAGGVRLRDNNNNNVPHPHFYFLCTELTDISRKRKIGTGDKDLPLFEPPSYVTFGSALCHRLFLFPSLLVSALLIPVRTFHRFRLKDSPTFHFKTYKERQNYRYTVQSMWNKVFLYSKKKWNGPNLSLLVHMKTGNFEGEKRSKKKEEIEFGCSWVFFFSFLELWENWFAKKSLAKRSFLSFLIVF